MRSFWDDWAATARMRDRLACDCHVGVCEAHLFAGPHRCSISGALGAIRNRLARVSILHVREHLPMRQSHMVDALAYALTPRHRWAAERWAIAWQPPELKYQPRLLKYRTLSYVTVN